MSGKIYVSIILVLVSIMSYEFLFFPKHYAALERLSDETRQIVDKYKSRYGE